MEILQLTNEQRRQLIDVKQDNPRFAKSKREQLFMYNQMDKEAGSLDDVNERGL